MFGKATRGKSDHTKIRDKKYWMPSLFGPWKAHINYNWMNLWKLILWTAPIVIIFENGYLPTCTFWSKSTKKSSVKENMYILPPQSIKYLVQCPRVIPLMYIYSLKTTMQSLVFCLLLPEQLLMGRELDPDGLPNPSKESASLVTESRGQWHRCPKKWPGVGRKG